MRTAAEAARLAENLRVTFELHEAGVEMMRQTLRRQLPSASDDEIAERLAAWLRERPGAEHGDGEGVPVAWPRRAR